MWNVLGSVAQHRIVGSTALRASLSTPFVWCQPYACKFSPQRLHVTFVYSPLQLGEHVMISTWLEVGKSERWVDHGRHGDTSNGATDHADGLIEVLFDPLPTTGFKRYVYFLQVRSLTQQTKLR